MRIVVAAVGRLKPGPDRALAERYCGRASKAGRALGLRGPDIVEVRESRARETERRIHEEAASLNATLPPGAVKVVLDGRGQSTTSEEFASAIRSWRERGHPAAGFLIGGADGLPAELLSNADMILAFGAATWPHQLVRIMLLEQIYRMTTILSGHPYHRE